MYIIGVTIVVYFFAAVSVSGGSESVALTLLARQAFHKVIGITVDHRLDHEFSNVHVIESIIVLRPVHHKVMQDHCIALHRAC